MIIYVVKSGDTITSIGEEYGVPAEELISYNQLESPEQLVVGQTILIPQDGSLTVESHKKALQVA